MQHAKNETIVFGFVAFVVDIAVIAREKNNYFIVKSVRHQAQCGEV